MKVFYWADELWPVYDLFVKDDDIDYTSEGEIEIDEDVYNDYVKAYKTFLNLRSRVNEAVRKQGKKQWD